MHEEPWLLLNEGVVPAPDQWSRNVFFAPAIRWANVRLLTRMTLLRTMSISGGSRQAEVGRTSRSR
jgi:hypothetical protein